MRNLAAPLCRYIPWHELLRRTFCSEIVCPDCGGELKLIALVNPDHPGGDAPNHEEKGFYDHLCADSAVLDIRIVRVSDSLHFFLRTISEDDTAKMKAKTMWNRNTLLGATPRAGKALASPSRSK